MIPVDRSSVLDKSLEILKQFSNKQNLRGRFISLYLGLRRMRLDPDAPIEKLGSAKSTPISDIERYLDRLYAKKHRQQPFVVLTSPFGGSASPESPYSAHSGIKAPGRVYPTNTWRNNLGVQKGVGCPADSDTIASLLDHPECRLACPYIKRNQAGGHFCGIGNTAYRGEKHSIWLRKSDHGYQVVDLDHPAVTKGYLGSGDFRIPIFPLIGILYCMALHGVYPDRSRVGIPEFATDFGFKNSQIDSLFDCDPESTHNSILISEVEDSKDAIVQVLTVEEKNNEVPSDQLPDDPDLATLNSGVGAELIVARDLLSSGWTVRYRANQSGLGYDLEATRDEHKIYVEVKSSISFSELVLQESEWKAAQTFGNDFVLAVVDFYGTPERTVWYVRNPAANAVPTERSKITYRFVREHFDLVSVCRITPSF